MDLLVISDVGVIRHFQVSMDKISCLKIHINVVRTKVAWETSILFIVIQEESHNYILGMLCVVSIQIIKFVWG